MHTPKDFDLLRDSIYEECHEMVSISTLKRLWGYNRYEGTPRVSSLNPIARYVGYRDWDEYTLNCSSNEEQDVSNESLPPAKQKPNGHLGIYVLTALVLLIVAIGYGLLLNRHSSTEPVDALTSTDFFVPSGKRVLRKGQDCFRTILIQPTFVHCPIAKMSICGDRNICTLFGITRVTALCSCPPLLSTGHHWLVKRDIRIWNISDLQTRNSIMNDWRKTSCV